MKYSRQLAFLSAAVLGFSGISTALPASFSVYAEEDLVYGGMQYEISDGEITILRKTEDLLAEVVIPAEIDGVPVTKIHSGAFAGAKITSVSIPEGIRRIGDRAFYECTMLESVFIPASVRKIGSAALCTGEFTSYNAGVLQSIDVAEENPYYTSVDGVLYTKDMQKLVQFPNGRKMDEFRIPDSVKVIGAYSIHNAKVPVVAPDGLEHIEDYAFWCWSYGYSFRFPSSLKTIGVSAFGNAELDPDKTVLPACLERISREAFYYHCPSRVTILNPYCYISQRKDTFYNCRKEGVGSFYDGTICGYDGSTAERYANKWGYQFESLGPIPDELKDWKPEPLTENSLEWNEDPDVKWYEYTEYEDNVWITALQGDSEEDVWNYKLPETINGKPVVGISCGDIRYISSLRLPKTLEFIPSNDFNEGLVMLDNIFVDPENPYFTDIEGVLFNKDVTRLLAYPGDHAVPKGEYINDYDPSWTYTVPDTVTELADCSFFGANIGSIQLPAGLEIIGDECFWCSRLLSLDVPENVRELDREAFEGCTPITAVNVSPENPYFSSEDGILYDKDKTYLIFAPYGEIVDRFVIPDTVERIHWNGFARGYRELVIPASVKDVGERNLTSLGINVSTAEKITVDENNSVYRSEDGILFKGDSLLIYPAQKHDRMVYQIPDGTTMLAQSAIRDNNSLRFLIACEGLRYIGNMCCQNLSNLEAVYLPDSLQGCGVALSENGNLKTIYYGGTEEQFSEITWGIFGDTLLKDRLGANIEIVYNASGIPAELLETAAPAPTDFNCDGETTVSDAVFLARLLSENTAAELPAGTAPDLDGDGFLTLLDVTKLLRSLLA